MDMEKFFPEVYDTTTEETTNKDADKDTSTTNTDDASNEEKDPYIGFEVNDVDEETKKEFEDAEVEETKDKKGKKKIKIKIKHPGAMTEYCKKKGYDGVTCGCLCEAMNDPDPVWHKRANFAYVFGFRKNGKQCACMEEIYKKRKKEKNKK